MISRMKLLLVLSIFCFSFCRSEFTNPLQDAARQRWYNKFWGKVWTNEKAMKKIFNGSLRDFEPGEAIDKNDTIISCYHSYDPKNNRSLDIDVSLCTHLNVFGMTAYANGTASFTSLEDVKKLLKLKKQNPDLKLLITGGGEFAEPLKDPLKTKRLADQISHYVKESGIDGFDLDWEINGLNPFKQVYTGMTEFLQAVRENFNRQNRKLYLTVAVQSVNIVQQSYDVRGLNKYVDFINLMTYDFHQFLVTQPYTGYNSPLFKRPSEIWVLGWINTAWAAFHWHKEGMDMKKIVVGIPTYARTYTLVFPFWHTVYAPAKGHGTLGQSTTYDQVCQVLKDNYVRVWDEHAKVPYCYKQDQWISYDDLESVAEKAVWIQQQGFGGAMIFDFNSDDFDGVCDGETRFPLHRRIYDIIKG